jgi:hypothetical protein
MSCLLAATGRLMLIAYVPEIPQAELKYAVEERAA